MNENMPRIHKLPTQILFKAICAFVALNNNGKILKMHYAIIKQ
jgi:hypothetical protein